MRDIEKWDEDNCIAECKKHWTNYGDYESIDEEEQLKENQEE